MKRITTESMTTEEFHRLRGSAPAKAQGGSSKKASKSPRFRKPGMTKYGKRHVPGEMNKTEEKFAARLDERKSSGEVVEWHFEAVTFKLAKGVRYTSDFAVLFPDGSMEFVDTKGGGPIDAKSIVKIKTAAEKFPQFVFVMEQYKGKQWHRREF